MNTMHKYNKRTTISVSEKVYQGLKEVGHTADSFDSVIWMLLQKYKESQ